MAATNPAPSPQNRSWSRRLQGAFRFLAAIAAAFAIAAFADLVSFAGALILLAAVVIGVALIRIDGDRGSESALARDEDTDGLLPGTRRLAEALPDPCFVLSADGSVVYANDRAVETFGIKAGELLPFRLRYPELVAAFGKVTSGAGPQHVQFVERVPTERSFAAWFAPLDPAPGKENYILVLDDLTEARATERMRVDFVANASHELRTPLASLSGFIETLQGAAKDDPQARNRFLTMMHEQAMRMKRLIDDLLSLSRVEMRAHARPSEKVDLNALLRHVIDTLAPLARELEVRIEADLPAGKIMIAADRDELVQVFNNLIENACKYGSSGKRVVVRAAGNAGGKGCSVAVIDFGPGIAAEHLPRLTERFYRVDAEESRRHRGTGLGLAIVKHIVGRHRGRLQIESEPGRGAQFVVKLPEAELVPDDTPEKPKSDQAVTVS
jgi:two-component system phosphate regulon sensor histidine kinase PhoR